jgi:hypothetical protein
MGKGKGMTGQGHFQPRTGKQAWTPRSGVVRVAHRMKTCFMILAALGLAVIYLGFAAQASMFYKWNNARADAIAFVDKDRVGDFQKALWKMHHPPPAELHWLRWLGGVIVAVAVFGVRKTRNKVIG